MHNGNLLPQLHLHFLLTEMEFLPSVEWREKGKIKMPVQKIMPVFSKFYSRSNTIA